MNQIVPWIFFKMKSVTPLVSRTIGITCLLIMLNACASKFNSSEWKKHNDPTEIDNPRWDMVRDLMDQLEKTEITENELYEMLGEPNEIKVADGNKHLYYSIGWKSGFGIDPDFFVIELNSKGELTSCWQHQG